MMDFSNTAPPNDIVEFISYDPGTGEFYRFKPSRNSKATGRADRPCPETSSQRGYCRVCFRERYYAAHRLAWFFITGSWPNHLIDHINGDKNDNRSANLRAANYSQNVINSPARGTILRGVAKVGVNRFQSSIAANNRKYYLGVYNTPEAAHHAYMQAAKLLHKDFARST